ncbi:MAG TPA: hypothetical protein VF211_06690 [Burkholderiales bacterium]
MADHEPTRSSVHQLNNLFQVILGSLELLKRSREATPETVETALRATREASLLAQRLLASLRRGAPEPQRAREGETVLLVEDDGEVRRWAAAALESLGYRVLQATDAAAALEVLDSPAARRVDLVLTDVVLAAGAARRPTLFLEKPYDPERLAASVRAAIDSASSSAAPSDIGLPNK